MGRRRDELLERAGTLPVLRSGARSGLLAVKAQGSRVYDVDNVGYVDYLGGAGAAVVGYANQFVLDAVKKVLTAGIPEGFHVPQEVDLAASLEAVLPWVHSWWFCRHQDEAMRQALQWARRRTERDLFLILDGGAPLRIGAQPRGRTTKDAVTVREVPGWDVDRIEAAVAGGAKKVAALVLDPLMTRIGLVPPPDGALERIAEACRASDVVLILDERVSGFRLHRGGAAAWFGLEPDVAVYGGSLGGGFPIGVVAFRDGLADVEPDPTEPMPIPHPVSLAAAEAVCSILKNDSVYERLEERGQQLETGLAALAERFSRPMVVNRLGSAFALYMAEEPVTGRAAAEASDGDAYRRLAGALLGEGVLLPQCPNQTAYVSAAHGAKDIDETLSACEEVLLRFHQEDLP